MFFLVIVVLLLEMNSFMYAMLSKERDWEEWENYCDIFQKEIFSYEKNNNNGNDDFIVLEEDLPFYDKTVQSEEENGLSENFLGELSVTGQSFLGGKPVIFFENNQTHKKYYLAEGEKKEGYTLQRIGPKEVFFEVQGKVLKVKKQF